MGTFNSLVNLINFLTQNAIAIAGALAVLTFVVRCILVLVHTDNSPAGRAERWGGVRLAALVAFLIGAGVVLMRLFIALGGRLQ